MHHRLTSGPPPTIKVFVLTSGPRWRRRRRTSRRRETAPLRRPVAYSHPVAQSTRAASFPSFSCQRLSRSELASHSLPPEESRRRPAACSRSVCEVRAVIPLGNPGVPMHALAPPVPNRPRSTTRLERRSSHRRRRSACGTLAIDREVVFDGTDDEPASFSVIWRIVVLPCAGRPGITRQAARISKTSTRPAFVPLVRGGRNEFEGTSLRGELAIECPALDRVAP